MSQLLRDDAVDPLRGLALSVVTPMGAQSIDWISSAARSVADARRRLEQRGASLQWVVALDGVDRSLTIPQADTVVSWSRSRGVSAARNAALASCNGDWVIPLDADDELNAPGVEAAASVAGLLGARLGWVGLNRVLTTGEPTRHWFDSPEEYREGRLADQWTSPFAFHPNSFIAKRDLLWRAGGWPATAVNEDLALALLAGEESDGMRYPAILTAYRTWDGQEVALDSYSTDKAQAFRVIQEMVSSRRLSSGRPIVKAPISGVAHGRQTVSPEPLSRDLHGLTIGLDLDGVVCDYVAGMQWWLTGDTRGLRPLTYDLKEWFASKEEKIAAHTLAVESGLYTWQPPMAGAVSAIRRLQATGARVVAVSARGSHGEIHPEKAVEAWSDAFGVRFDDLHLGRPKYRNGIDVYIDDSPAEIERLRQSSANVVIFDQPWNKSIPGPRLSDWNSPRALESAVLASPP